MREPQIDVVRSQMCRHAHQVRCGAAVSLCVYMSEKQERHKCVVTDCESAIVMQYREL